MKYLLYLIIFLLLACSINAHGWKYYTDTLGNIDTSHIIIERNDSTLIYKTKDYFQPLKFKIDTVKADTTIIDWKLEMIYISTCLEPKNINGAHLYTLMGCPSGVECNYCMTHREQVGKAVPVYKITYDFDTLYYLSPEQLNIIKRVR